MCIVDAPSRLCYNRAIMSYYMPDYGKLPFPGDEEAITQPGQYYAGHEWPSPEVGGAPTEAVPIVQPGRVDGAQPGPLVSSVTLKPGRGSDGDNTTIWPLPQRPRVSIRELVGAGFRIVTVSIAVGGVALWLVRYLAQVDTQGNNTVIVPTPITRSHNPAPGGIPNVTPSPTTPPKPPTTAPSPTPKPTQPAQPSPTSQPTPSVAPGPQYETTNQPVTLPNGQQVGPGTALDVQCKTGTDASEQYYLVGGGEVSSADFVKRDDPELAGC